MIHPKGSILVMGSLTACGFAILITVKSSIAEEITITMMSLTHPRFELPDFDSTAGIVSVLVFIKALFRNSRNTSPPGFLLSLSRNSSSASIAIDFYRF
jgi:hypothetical protein